MIKTNRCAHTHTLQQTTMNSQTRPMWTCFQKRTALNEWKRCARITTITVQCSVPRVTVCINTLPTYWLFSVFVEENLPSLFSFGTFLWDISTRGIQSVEMLVEQSLKNSLKSFLTASTSRRVGEDIWEITAVNLQRTYNTQLKWLYGGAVTHWQLRHFATSSNYL